MLVWGGRDGGGRPLFDGASYDPVGNRWRLLSASPISGPGDSVGAWIGQAWLVVHGFGDATRDSVQVAWYEPQLDRWRELEGLGVPPGSSVSLEGIGFEALMIIKPDSGRSIGMRLSPRNVAFESAQPPFDGLNAGSSIAWTGELALVATSGETVPDAVGVWDQVVQYDPVADSWRIAALPPDALHSLDPVWSGRYAFFFGGDLATRAYDPIADRWFEVLPSDDGFREGASVIWAGDQLLVWGGSGGGTGTRRRDGVRFVPTPIP